MVPGNSITTYYTPNMYAYNLSFAGSQSNYAAALAITMAVITMAIAYVGAAQQHEGADEVTPWGVRHPHKTWIFQGA